jgi:phosphatidylethanolamine-binding protein (PEBP) family uncharacterized protein
MPFTLTSPAFQQGAPVPAQHTCEGADASPPLEWSGLPAGTRSLALIIDDPDAPDPAAPKRVWVHWMLHFIGSKTDHHGPATPRLSGAS